MNVTSIIAFGSVCLGFFMGTAWVSGMQNLEINRLNSRIQSLESDVQSQQKTVDNHKQFINRKGQLVARFCKEYGAK